MKLLTKSCSIALATAVSSSPANAQSLVPVGQCAVVVASRPSIDDARQYIIAGGLQPVAHVFASSNGWYAIAAGFIQSSGSTAVIAQKKLAHEIPNDAYCSTGEMYVEEVNWRAAVQDPNQPASEGLWADFDARPLTRAEKRFLQAALAMAGFYTGLIDGAWGEGSQAALERYSFATFETEPTNAHAAWLTGITAQAWLDDGWEYEHIRHINISAMIPSAKLMMVSQTGAKQSWEHREKDLRVIFEDLETDYMKAFHGAVATMEGRIGSAYRHRGTDRWVTSVMFDTGTVYVRSDLISGTWSTTSIYAGPGLKGEVGLISGSIQVGSPPWIVPEPGGVLLTYSDELFAILDDEGSEAAPNLDPNAELSGSVPPKRNADGDSVRSTGTAFFVTDDGIALTNAHVVEGCNFLALGGNPASVVAVSSNFDLAALRISVAEPTKPLLFAAADASLNADITIAGFPLHGLLGGLNVNRGSVSSMKGLQGDESSIQISAPVQPGNSGGPVIDRYGNVVGVVVAKLNTLALADATGDIAQNVNFAIRGSLAKVFLSSNGIDFALKTDGEVLAPEASAELLRDATHLVECK
ncbi:trypsin-like peptidase domain-containing protein [Albidovulum sediminicola]|uniref:Trypsin-like peptidase domain-containing protein n=1 Tax=Albidovulum sediminicola TaxID=2984331 RepID=A0ABT2Z128_9RHOB|nr:trypsin-like peptidase domain-containing protein [Defluviimonas sp. WL0075]MCV2864848.1 trypsin-like peptidase domain-containing protein [Defluviimonas sp. WL0075]